MNIYFSPVSMFASYSLEVAGDSVVIDGQAHLLADLSTAPEGVALPQFVASATEDSVTMLLPYWGEASEAVAYPAPMIDVPDGQVELPQ